MTDAELRRGLALCSAVATERNTKLRVEWFAMHGPALLEMVATKRGTVRREMQSKPEKMSNANAAAYHGDIDGDFDY